ncbi:MAG: phosphoribosylformylglycinamidine synthase subunit PurQ [Alphaproteobacteria bacterium]|nr:phosphoribosylformylglycinamidine synthase subunit PurQ [Alphaproteobacteria bacterium]
MTAKALIISGYGLNCEEETAFAFEHVGFDPTIRHINDLIDAPEELNDVQALCIPGGFSYGDDTGSGNAFAQKMTLTLGETLRKFVERDTLTLGICNGCQIAANLGLAPALDNQYGIRQVALMHNASARYQCRWVDLNMPEKHSSPWLQGISTMHIPVAHGEGRFMMEDATLKSIQKNNQIALRYTKDRTPANGEFPYNPNGSTDDIAAITDPTGRILIMMPHPERGMFTWQRDDYALLKDKAARSGTPLPKQSDGMALFANAANYFGINAMKKAG